MLNKKDRIKFLSREIKRMERLIEILPKSYPYKAELKREGLRSIKEGIRQQYDRFMEEIDAAKTRLDVEYKKTKDKDQKVIEMLVKLRTRREEETKQMLEQLKGLEGQIDDMKEEWIMKAMNNQLESARAYLQLIKNYLKKVK